MGNREQSISHGITGQWGAGNSVGPTIAVARPTAMRPSTALQNGRNADANRQMRWAA